MSTRPGFHGFRRPDGRVGVRNHVLVVPTVVCSAVVTERIAAAVRRCGATAPSRRLRAARTRTCRSRTTRSRRTASIRTSAPSSSSRSAASRWSRRCSPSPPVHAGKPSAIVSIQGEGGTPRAIAKGTGLAAGFADDLTRAGREWSDIDALILSLKCGGSDYTSGLAANPALGHVADRLHSLGASTVLGEIAEIMGAEHLLAARATQPEVAARLLRVVNRVESEAKALGLDIRGTQPVARQHSRRPYDNRREVTRCDPQGRRTRAARRRRRVLLTHHAEGPDGHGHAGPGRRVGHRNGRWRRAGRGVHDRARDADREPDRAGDQDHGQRAHCTDDGRQHRPGCRAASSNVRNRWTRAADRLLEEIWQWARENRLRPSGSAIANSRFIDATRRFDRKEVQVQVLRRRHRDSEAQREFLDEELRFDL